MRAVEARGLGERVDGGLQGRGVLRCEAAGGVAAEFLPHRIVAGGPSGIAVDVVDPDLVPEAVARLGDDLGLEDLRKPGARERLPGGAAGERQDGSARRRLEGREVDPALDEAGRRRDRQAPACGVPAGGILLGPPGLAGDRRRTRRHPAGQRGDGPPPSASWHKAAAGRAGPVGMPTTATRSRQEAAASPADAAGRSASPTGPTSRPRSAVPSSLRDRWLRRQRAVPSPSPTAAG